MDNFAGSALAPPPRVSFHPTELRSLGDLRVGDHVRLTRGPLSGLLSIVTQVGDRRCVAQLPALGAGVYVRVPADMLAQIGCD